MPDSELATPFGARRRQQATQIYVTTVKLEKKAGQAEIDSIGWTGQGMNAPGRQTAPPQYEVVSVTSAVRVSLEAFKGVMDSIRAAAAGPLKGPQAAGLCLQFAQVIRVIAGTAFGFPILSSPMVSGA